MSRSGFWLHAVIGGVLTAVVFTGVAQAQTDPSRPIMKNVGLLK